MTTTPEQPQTTGHDAEIHDDVPREELARLLASRTPIWKPVLVLAILVCAVGGVVGLGAIPRADRRENLKEANEALLAMGRRVQLGTMRVAPASRLLTLPASLQANARADLFAQASGYIRERRVDIGDQVKAGDVLAIIDIPLVDEQLNSARASLAEAEAARVEVEKNRDLARVTLDRWSKVEPQGAVSKQEIDERTSAVAAAEASYTAASAVVETRRADLQRIERQKAFGQIIAPFDGTITVRNIDVGDYIASTGPGAPPLFSIADTQTIRVFVDVPQAYAQNIEKGQTATIVIRESADQKLQGTVTRTSGVLNEQSRTLRVEVTLPNETGRVLAGAYGQVQFDVKQTAAPVIVPGAALLVRAEGTRVAIVDDDGRLKYVPVTISRDLGIEVEVVQGLTGKERLVVNMADELPEGTLVEIIPMAVAPSAPAVATPANAPATVPPSATAPTPKAFLK